MSDLETRLTEVLCAEAEGAPDAVGLAQAARTRARVRRRTTIGTAAALAVTALVVPIAIVALGGDGGSDNPPVAEESTAVDPGAVRRVETYHNVSILVPADWGYGSLSVWCVGGREPGDPVVERPGGVVPMIACGDPADGYGVRFGPRPDNGSEVVWPVATQTSGLGFPVGAAVGARTIGDIVVTVSVDDARLAQEILDSMTRVEGVDPNGCAPTEAGPADPPRSGMSVCRYLDGRLEESGQLDAPDAASAEAALEAAVIGDLDCERSGGSPQIVLMRSARHVARLELDGSCQTFVLDGEPGHIVSADVRGWARLPGDPLQ